jgi:hypothetical protein
MLGAVVLRLQLILLSRGYNGCLKGCFAIKIIFQLV